MSAPLDLINLEVKFPLPDGRALVQGPLTYNQDGVATKHNADFMRDARFLEAYRVGMENARADQHVEWRVHVALWCATQAAALEGDFVECGVHTGILAGAVMTWLDFARLEPRVFYLFDTWRGIPPEQVTEDEKARGSLEVSRKYEDGENFYNAALKKFARWPNAALVRGRVPDSLAAIAGVKKVAFVSIDMNIAAPEIAAAESLWPRLVPGGLILLDDYGWPGHDIQKRAWDEWAARAGVMILSLPTGQALIAKPR